MSTRADHGMLDKKCVDALSVVKITNKEWCNFVETSPRYTKGGLFTSDEILTIELFAWHPENVIPMGSITHDLVFGGLYIAWTPDRARGVLRFLKLCLSVRTTL